MLEELIKSLITAIIISLIIFYSVKSVSDNATQALINAKQSSMINELRNLETDKVISETGLIICKPALINNEPGRVCLES